MNNSTIFQQILHLVPENIFNKLVNKYKTDRYSKSFKTIHQFKCLLYAQAKRKVSLRDITTGLMVHANKQYHLGLPTTGVKRSTLADCNKRIDYRIYQDLFYELLRMYKTKIFGKKFNFDNPLYAIDASFVNVIIDMFDWAKFRSTKGAVKLHVMFDVAGQIPTFMNITTGKVHDLEGKPYLDRKNYSDSIITFDKGYWSVDWLAHLNIEGIFFVTRIKENVNYEVTGQQEIELGTGVLKDETIKFTSEQLSQEYPEDLRFVTYYDKQHQVTYKFVTNIFGCNAKTIAEIYKYRWQIEIFFKWIKQNLKIKTFLGTSKNAVFSQIWIAMIYYLLLSYVHTQSSYPYSKLELTRVIEEVLFESMSLVDIFSANFKSVKKIIPQNTDQLYFDTS